MRETRMEMRRTTEVARLRWVKAALLAAILVFALRTKLAAQDLVAVPIPEPAVRTDADARQVVEFADSRLPMDSAILRVPEMGGEGLDPVQRDELPNAPSPSGSGNSFEEADKKCQTVPCPKAPRNWYMRFMDGPQVTPMSPKEKGWLALRNLVDPFNAITILGEAGISVGADAHGPDGPGMAGFGRYVGVSYTEDLTGEFFNTFLIPVLAHQDPRYHRNPHSTYFKRGLHAVTQVVWTRSDYGNGMLNYSNLVGFVIDDEIANLYVPGRQTNAEASAKRYAIGLATAPIDNFVTEFLPDVAKHIHVQVVIVQRIINQVAKTGGTND